MRRIPLVFVIACSLAACAHDDAATPVAPLPGDVSLASNDGSGGNGGHSPPYALTRPEDRKPPCAYDAAEEDRDQRFFASCQ